MFSAIQTMKFYLRTAYGDSATFYSGSETTPFQRSFQVNGASPAVWLVLSSLIIRCMYSMGNTMVLKTAWYLASVMFVAFSFVDDTDLSQIALSSDELIENVINRLQKYIREL